jgi:DNA-binding transcriptional MerR regulator
VPEKPSTNPSPTSYTIGHVAKLTGLSTHNIRKWEERYGAITPERTPGGDRRYGSDQVARLTMLKELVDSGDSISSVAGISDADLKKRCAAILTSSASPIPTVSRIGVIGDSLPTILKQHGSLMPGLEFVTLTSDEDAQDADLEVVLLEKPTLDEDIFDQLADVRDRFAVDIVVILYGYSPQSLALRLSSDTTACLRMPVNYRELQRTVNSLLPRPGGQRPTLEPSPVRYSKDVLAKVAAMSPTIACECPRHVAEIIFALTDFETYSANCEDKNPMDAAVHNYLRLTAAQARVAFEQALATVATHEQIPLEDWQQAEADR